MRTIIGKSKFLRNSLFLSAIIALNFNAYTQCTNTAAFGSATAPTTSTPTTITTCVYQQEYNTITGVVAGNTYSSTNSSGGCITVHSGTPGGPVVAFGPSPLSWTATVSGNYYIHYNTNCACGTATGCTTSTIACTSCGGGGGASPCTSITNIAACGTSVTTNLTGTGLWNVNTCGFTTSGSERIYSFTPTVSGTYSINVTSATGGFIDYFWMNSTTGCGSTGWTCIDDIASTGTWGSMTWTAGQTYYILLDAEPTSATSQTWSINCIAAGGSPCTSITNITGCGVSVTTNLTGTGSWNVTACGFTTSGSERIYSFTPTVSGTYSINVTSATGGFIDYFWMNSTTGCGSTGWNCIDDIAGTGNFGSMAWTAGQTYYILLDAEPTSATSQTWSINCITAGTNPCTSITNIAGCGTSVSATMTGGGAPWNITACGFSTPGDEVIFSFTPTTTGLHSINVTSITNGFIDFFYVNAASGCSSAAPWTCIDDVAATGILPGINLTAGVTYYILLDPENTVGSTATFSINCPGSAVTAGDCTSPVNVCTNLTFSVDPSGFGSINELCTGCVSNPSTNPSGFNSGCLLSGELNSTWMVVNISTSGTLEFSFGAPGGTVCYDWIMWPYNALTCNAIISNSLAPIRCNWNSPCVGYTGIGTLPAGGNAGNWQPALNVTAGQQYIICFSNYSSATTTVPLNFYGTAGVSCSPLPVELVSFNGYKINKEVKLIWRTNSEPTTTHYEIMHSTDGTNYNIIGTKEANGASNVTSNYDFMHTNPVTGVNYYKLGMIDNQNRAMESDPVVINFDAETITIGDVYPNPSNGMSYMDIYSAEETSMTINIIDVSGKTISSQQINLIKGSNKIEINTSVLAKGLYNFSVSHPENIAAKVQKLIIE